MQTSRHEHRFGIVAVAEAVGDTGRKRNDVLERTAELAAGDIVIDIDAECCGAEPLLHEICRHSVRGCRNNARRDISADLLCMRRTGQDNICTLRQLLRKDGAHEFIGILLDALACIDDHRALPEMRCDLLAGASDKSRRDCKQDKVAVVDHRKIGRQGNAARDFDAGQLFLLLAISAHCLDFRRNCAPKGYIVLLCGIEHHSKSGTETAAKNCYFRHVTYLRGQCPPPLI